LRRRFHSKQFSKAIEGYIIAALAEDYSHSILTTYRSALNTMVEFIGDKDVFDIMTEDLHGFMNYMVTEYTPKRRTNPSNIEPLSIASRYHYWKAMRSFFIWAERNLGMSRPSEEGCALT
jgi:integrase/recombinase XerD